MFKFSIRDLLFVTAIAGLTLGWALDHFAQSRRNGRLADKAAAFENLSDELARALRIKHPLARVEIKVNQHGGMGIYSELGGPDVFSP